jgi:hypothetical protein
MYVLKRTSTLTVALALMVALLFGALAMFGGKAASAQAAGPPSGDGIQPTSIAGNPNCASLGYAHELKVEPVVDGTYPDNNGPLQATIDTRDTAAGPVFDWTSNLGVDVVIVKGGDNADSYVYDPPKEDISDTNLHAPINANNGKFFGLSHISFCYDLELNVSKTANTSLTRTFAWTIDKSVGPDTWDLFRGDSGTSEYSVAITKNQGTDSDWKVFGTISVKSPIDNANVTGLSDVVSHGNPAVSINATILACTKNGNPVGIPSGQTPVALNDEDTLACTYEALVPNGDDGKNTATATTTTAALGNGTGTANVDFGQATVNRVNDQVTVKDVFKGNTTTLGTAADSKTFDPYTHTFECDADEGTHENTATVYGDGDAALDSDKASVTVNCHELTVSKDAQTSLEKRWTWTADKSADKSEIVLSLGQSLDVNYEVVYDATSTEGEYAVSGKITVKNDAPIDAKLTSVSDVISGGVNTNVDCPDADFPNPYTLGAGQTLTCTYSADLPNKDARTNTATSTLQNFDYDANGGKQASGTNDFSGSAAVNFANATVTEIDEEITVSDTYSGSSVTGTVAANQAPKTFNYVRQVGPYQQCGNQPPIENTADFVTNDTGTEGQDSVSIPVRVPCSGCTLTIGYWKTHADPSSPRNNPDETLKVLAEQPNGTIWLGTPNGAKSVAVTSTNVVSILSFEGSNGIRKLQAQLLAAKLNIANGANGSSVQSTIAAADLFLAQNGANSWNDLSKAKKQKVLGWMSTLDDFNNGLIGPGHCSEESTTSA